MPGPPATETVTWVRAHRPATRVVILTAHREDAWVRELLDRGAAGYILKDDALDAAVRAVRGRGGRHLAQPGGPGRAAAPGRRLRRGNADPAQTQCTHAARCRAQ